MRRILVLRGGALGDFIVTLPALLALRERWPAAEIELIGNTTAAELARKRGVLQAVYSQHEQRWSRLYDDAPLPQDLATWFGRFDLILNYWPDPDGTLLRHFPVRPGQRILTAPALPTRAPAAAHYAEPLRDLDLATQSDWCRIDADRILWGSNTDGEANRTPTRGNGPIAIHPGSGSRGKNWPADRWLNLIERLRAPIRVFLGEAELERWPATALSRFGHVEPVIGRSLEQLTDEFHRCRLFLGHDSGVSHLAAACGAECILLFGPTDPAVWAPPSPSVTILRAGDELTAITTEQVEAAITRALESR